MESLLKKPKKKKKAPPKIQQEYVWIVAYINPQYVSKIQRELNRFDGIEAYIPVVKILKKRFKGKEEFEDIPLLFNYGFLKMPKSFAYNPEFLAQLRSKISCISGWLKDTSRNNLSSRIFNRKDLEKLSPVAIATDEEISGLLKAQEDLSIYSNRELTSIKEGDHIILQGYPFEGLPAKVLKVNYVKKEVEVEVSQKLFGKTPSRIIKVNFQNVFYTIYKSGYDDSLSNHLSFDELTQGRSINPIYTRYNHEE